MGKTNKIHSFDSQIIYNSQESQGQKIQCSNSFINDVLEKQMDSEQSTKIKKEGPIKIIQKIKKTNVKSGKWSGANRINYYKGILKFAIQHPYYCISWKYWKPQKFYPKMVEQINKNQQFYKKDVIQTKSFDERQRKQYFQKGSKLDMIDLSILKLKQAHSIDPEAQQILAAYHGKTKQKSLHMKMLDQSLEKLKQQKYVVEDLYHLIIGDENLKMSEQFNSCFYQ